MSNPWFRMYAEFSSDLVVQSLAFDDQRHYIVILCLKCQGVLDRKLLPENRERIILRGLGLDEKTASKVKRRLMEVEFISGDWQPLAWDKRQFKTDNTNVERKRKSRKSLKNMESSHSHVTNRYVSVSVSNLLSLYKNVSPEIWEEFEQHRKEVKKLLTELSAKKNMQILNSLTIQQQQISVDATIANRWTGLFPPKEIQKKTKGKIGRAINAIEQHTSKTIGNSIERIDSDAH